MSLTDQTVEIKGSPFKLVGLVILGALMTALSGAIAFGYIPAREGSFVQFAGWAGTIFFGGATLVILKRLTSAGETVITLSKSGFLDKRLSERPIPWASIQDVLVWTMQGQKIIVLQVPPDIEKSVGLTRTARWSRAANAKLGADGLCTMASGLKISHADLLEAITRRVEAANSGH